MIHAAIQPAFALKARRGSDDARGAGACAMGRGAALPRLAHTAHRPSSPTSPSGQQAQGRQGKHV